VCDSGHPLLAGGTFYPVRLYNPYRGLFV
jgi:hypothetical protein